MFLRLFAAFVLALCLGSPVLAQDGQQLFSIYCSACHGQDGKGATAGTFPPLAGSPYVKGEPDRAVKIVLKGLTGPVDVLGKTFNLEMPPQGAVLSDDQVAAILTYVRGAWGNQDGPVSADKVKTIRAAIADRAMPWTGPELLKLHPLPFEQTALKNLTKKVYKGDWKYLPEFAGLKAESVEEEHDGIISLKNLPYKEHYCVVWEGTFEVPVEGDYHMRLDADDAARLIIDGTVVTEIHGLGKMDGSRRQGDISTYTKGPHSIRVEYLQYTDTQGIALSWKGPGSEDVKWFTEPPTVVPKAKESILLQPVNGRPVIYRNFITGVSPRAIGVGFPGGFNLAYSTDDMAPRLLWTGKFIDAANKWLGRGTDPNPPAGENVVPLQGPYLDKDARFKGYELDRAGNPTFRVALGKERKQMLLDAWRSDGKSFVRTLTLTGKGQGIVIPVVAASGDQKSPAGSGIEVLPGGAEPVVMKSGTVKLEPSHPVTLTYKFKPSLP